MSSTTVVASTENEQSKVIKPDNIKKIVEKDKAERVNLFSMIAVLLKSLRESLEKQDNGYDAPKWVRIVRVRDGIEFKWNEEKKEFEVDKDKTSFLARTTITSSSFLVTAIAEMQRYTFKGEKFLTEMDSLVALLQVMLSLIRSMTSDDFIKPVMDLLELENKENPLKGIRPGLDMADKFLRLVPRPEDLNVIKQELYQLLVIEYETANGKTFIDIEKSGKIRVMQLAFMQGYKLYGLEPESEGDKKTDSMKVTLLGASILTNESKYKKSSKDSTSGTGLTLITTLDGTGNAKSKEELTALMNRMGYTENDPIKQFKLINGLDKPDDNNVNAQVINLLMGVDVKYKTLREPKHLNAKTQKYINKIETFNNVPNSNITAMQIPNRGDTAGGNQDVWDNEGFPAHHIAAFMQVANAENCIIMTRTPGKACLTVLEEGYDAKSFHIKAKSCQSGVAAGFLCLDPLLNKGGAKGALGNLLSNHKSLETTFETSGSGIDYKSSTTPLMLSGSRIAWLNDTNEKNSTKFFPISSFNKNNFSEKYDHNGFVLLKSNVSKSGKDKNIPCYYVFHDFSTYGTYNLTKDMLNSAISGNNTDLNSIIENEDKVLTLQDDINTFSDYEAVLKNKIRDLEKKKADLAKLEDKEAEIEKKETEIEEEKKNLENAVQSRQDKLNELKGCLESIKTTKNKIQTSLLGNTTWEKSISNIISAFTSHIQNNDQEKIDATKNVNNYFIYHFIIDTLTHKLRLLDGKNAWGGKVDKNEITNYFPLLAMTNPYLNYQGEDYYLNAVVGDYDLFAVWPLQEELSDDDLRLIDMTPTTKKEDIFKTEDQTTKRIKDQRGGSTTGTAVGNISMRVQFIGQLINTAIADGPQSSMINRVFHSDEGGRPGIDEVDTAVAFTPYHQAYYLPGKKGNEPNGAEFLKFGCFARSKEFAVLLNNGWIKSLNTALQDSAVKAACGDIYSSIKSVTDVSNVKQDDSGKDIFATWLGAAPAAPAAK